VQRLQGSRPRGIVCVSGVGAWFRYGHRSHDPAAFPQFFLENTLACQQKTEREESTGRQYVQQESPVAGYHRQLQEVEQIAEQQLGIGEQGAAAQDFTHGAQRDQRQCETQAHHQSVCHRGQWCITRGEGFRATENGAVGDD
jgi:hypothetical protein